MSLESIEVSSETMLSALNEIMCCLSETCIAIVIASFRVLAATLPSNALLPTWSLCNQSTQVYKITDISEESASQVLKYGKKHKGHGFRNFLQLDSRLVIAHLHTKSHSFASESNSSKQLFLTIFSCALISPEPDICVTQQQMENPDGISCNFRQDFEKYGISWLFLGIFS